MESESARMTTAAEARFRINAPNSQPRSVKVIALDTPSQRVIAQLAKGKWNRTSFFSTATSGNSIQLKDLSGRAFDLEAEVANANLVVMIASSGENSQAAGIIGEACKDKRVMTTALVLGSEAKTDEALSKTLAQLRPHALMVVIASAEEYIEDMLTALRA